MKVRLLGAAAVLALVTVVSPLLAQTATMSVNIPFEFSAGGKIHPAGDYRVSASSGTTLVQFVNFDASLSTQVLAIRADVNTRNSPPSHLVFRRYGDQYFLSAVWNAGGAVARRIVVSREETELARTFTAGQPELVTLLAKR